MENNSNFQQLWEWNKSVPERDETCVHEHIATKAQQHPRSPAICAWNGSMNYEELEEVSTRLAHHLVNQGVGSNVIVPLSFEKSLWTTVAMLAVIKAGGAFVALDISQPLERLRSIVKQVGATIVLTSVKNKVLAESLGPKIVLVDQDKILYPKSWDEPKSLESRATSSSLLYVVFTSGSTGAPKGVLISHSNHVSSVQYHAQAIGISSKSRVYDFASYSFDIAIHNALTTLMVGGCICVPSEEDRKNDIPGSIESLKANFAHFTPSVARLIQPSTVPSLVTVILEGEPLTRSDISQWQHMVEIKNAYGPAECGITSVATPHLLDDAANIGHATGAVYWVVDPADTNHLMPIGEVGELLIEGPSVGCGYLNDSEKTSAAFIDSPQWLLEGYKSYNGRTGRLYKTGDLVRFNVDGSLSFLGRADSQVKIRGQRVELGEIEHNLRSRLPTGVQVVAEVIKPGNGTREILVAFIQISRRDVEEENVREENEDILVGVAEARSQLKSLDETGLTASLRSALPEYMIPTFYIPVWRIPMTTSGKTSRRQLKQLGMSFSLENVAEITGKGVETRRAPTTAIEGKLQCLWGIVLGITPEFIGIDDNFFRIGGDSIGAMRLVALAREVKIRLTVLGIFNFPCLLDMAHQEAIEYTEKDLNSPDSGGKNTVLPFSLLGDLAATAEIRNEARQQCNVREDLIEDIYPTTPLQEGLLALTAKDPKAYINRIVVELPYSINLDKFKAAFEKVVKSNMVLRTRIIQVPSYGSMQVVIHEDIDWVSENSLATYMDRDSILPMGPGDPLARYGIVHGQETNGNQFIWTLHHALYDGWSIHLLATQVEKTYQGLQTIPGAQFNSFIRYLLQQEKDDHKAFWQSELMGAEDCAVFPVPQILSNVIRADGQLEYQLQVPTRNPTGITMSILIRAAWAILMARLTGSEDILFGVTVIGRNASVHKIEEMTGPTIATVPLRVHVGRDISVSELLRTMQKQSVEMIPFEQTGMQNIRRFNRDTKVACNFQSLLVIQPRDDSLPEGQLGLLAKTEEDNGLGNFNSYALMLLLKEHGSHVAVQASFDTNVIGEVQAQWLVEQLERVLQQLCNLPAAASYVKDVECQTQNEIQRLWEWNKEVPVPMDSCVHDIIATQAQDHPRSPAICAWDGNFTYAELEDHSSRLAQLLESSGVEAGTVVPLCFEKSKWTTVAMLGVIKVGAAFVAMDIDQPEVRLATIAKEVNASFILSSRMNGGLTSRLASLVGREVINVIVVDMTTISKQLTTAVFSDTVKSKTTHSIPSSLLNIVFTSGSTGVPKGAMMTHASFYTGLQHHKDVLGFSSESRTFDFCSYSFDIAVHNALATLCVGGCLCVPSDSDRKNNLESSICSLGANIINITPSVGRTIAPEKVPSLKIVIFAGEALSKPDVSRWASTVEVRNLYGPAECALVTASSHQMALEDPSNIGRGMGGATWIVDPFCIERLVPLGAIGELIIEGPIVGAGYFNDAEKTAISFFEDAPWLLKGGRHGRLYKTGDLVKYNADGTLKFIGRKDNQVKVRGQRVELGEIEYHLRAALPDILGLAVEVIKPTDGEKSILAAFLHLKSSDSRPYSEDRLLVNESETKSELATLTAGLSEHLRTSLPDYMVPTAYIPVHKIPMTTTGKTNRKQLREQGALFSRQLLAELGGDQPRDRRMPTTLMESKLQQLYAHTLGLNIDSFGVDDSFILLGGDSISAMQLVAACRKEGISISVSKVLIHKTIAKVALLCQSGVTKLIQAQDESVGTEFALSPVQRWHFQLNPHGAARYNQSFLLCLKKHVCQSELSSALNLIVRRHSMLRARFIQAANHNWTQKILPYHDKCYRFSTHDLLNIEQIHPILNQSQDSLDLVNGPVFAADLCNVKGADQCLFLLAHHLVIDLVSWRLIWQDLEDILNNGSLSNWQPLTFQTWCNIDAERSGQIEDLDSVLPFPVSAGDYNFWGMANRLNPFGECNEVRFELDSSTTNLLLGVCNKAMRTETIDVLVSACLLSFQQTFPDRKAPSFFIESHGRKTWDESINLGETVGWFTAFLPFQVPLQHGDSIIDVLRLVKDHRRLIKDHGRTYFSCRHLHPDGPAKFGWHEPAEILINYAGVYQQLNRENGLMTLESRVALETPDTGNDFCQSSLFELNLEVVNGVMRFSFTYNGRMKHQQRIIEWIHSYEQTMKSVAQTLASTKTLFTKNDFPQLRLTYDGLDRLLVDMLPRLGIADAGYVEDIYPCTAMQEGILLAQSKEPSTYLTSFTWEILSSDQSTVINPSLIKKAWQEITDRHAILRTVFVESGYEDQHFIQIVQKRVNAHFAEIQCCGVSSAIEDLDRATQERDTIAMPMPNVIVCRNHSGTYFCKLNISHTMIDGMSLDILQQEFEEACCGSLIPRVVPKYSEFVKYENSLSSDESLAYWVKYMADVTPCHIPPLGTANIKDGTGSLKSLKLRKDVTNEAQVFCHKHGVTQSTLIQAAWALVLRQYTGLDNVCFGLLASGRDAPVDNIQDAVGLFISMMICRVDLSKPVSEVMQQINHDNAVSLGNQSCSLGSVQRAVNPSGNALFNTTMTVRRVLSRGNEKVKKLSFNLVDHESPTEYPLIVTAEVCADSIDVAIEYISSYISSEFATSIVGSFERTLQSLMVAGNEPITSLDTTGSHDTDHVWEWNNEIPSTDHSLVHDLIASQIQHQPQAPAICAWDGNLTYAQLDEQSSYVAKLLFDMGVRPETGVLVPLCFEKSMWASVAMVGVLKAGAAFIPMDASQPEERLAVIMKQANTLYLLSSALNETLARRLVPNILVVDKFLSQKAETTRRSKMVGYGTQMARLTPNSLVCAVFTSGSTGIPKGAMLTHSNFSSAIRHHAKALGFTAAARVYDFASYSFDVAVANTLYTLAVGGCICIPSDNDRKNDVVGSIAALEAIMVVTTPTLARLITPETVPTIKTVVFAGEPHTNLDARRWVGTAVVLNVYGPAECTVYSTITTAETPSEDTSNIGRGIGCVPWIVDPTNTDNLVPIGAVGELLLEGPIVGPGYLHQKMGFINDPSWLVKGTTKYTGRQAKLYRTGDLVRYNMDGTLHFVGRKDTQVKLNGQRVELLEVEHCLQAILYGIEVDNVEFVGTQVAVDIIPAKSGEHTLLAAFVRLPSFDEVQGVDSGASDTSAESRTSLVCNSAEAKTQLAALAGVLNQKLSNNLPTYMIPSIYIPVFKIPLTASGKTDRKRLKEVGSSLSSEQLSRMNGSSLRRQPRTEMEIKLLQFWEKVLCVDSASIGIDDHFFRMGGSSVGAMRMVGLARAAHIRLTVSDVFHFPILANMARVAVGEDVTDLEPILPFSLLRTSLSTSEVCILAAKQCGVHEKSIDDIYPATPMQESLLASTAKALDTYVYRSSFSLPSGVHVARFKEAWRSVAKSNPILRTSLVRIESHLFQVILKDCFDCIEISSISAHLDKDKKRPFGLGALLNRFALKYDCGAIEFLWTSHHSAYDGHSMPIILSQVQEAYESTNMSVQRSPVSFAHFIDYIRKQEESDALDWWEMELKDTTATPFPLTPLGEYQGSASAMVTTSFTFGARNAAGDKTLSTLIRLAWAIVVGKYTDSNDVIFGETLSGRDAPVPGIEEMTGPTLTTIPVRIRLCPDDSIGQALQTTMDKYISRIPFDQVGLQNIKRQAGGTFNNLLMIETASARPDGDLFLTEYTHSALENFTSFPLMITCSIAVDGLNMNIEAVFDPQVLSSEQTNRILWQLSHILKELETRESSTRIRDIQSIGPEDFGQIQEWNSDVPEPLNLCLHEMIESRVLENPLSLAVHAWDGQLTYAELDQLSTRLAVHLNELGVKAESLVPVCFEKSLWAIVAMLGVVKAGGAFVPLDPSHPKERIEFIVRKINARIILCSSKDVCEMHATTLVVDRMFLESLPDIDVPLKVDVQPHNALYVIFTSGSTGTPKGCVIEHTSWASGATSHGKALLFDTSRRMLQFTSYSFDVSIEEIFTTLLYGGVVCVPSEFERKNNLQNVIREMKVNMIDLTPSLAAALNPQELPDLEVCLIGGEVLTKSIIKQWASHVKLINAYGPTECTIQCVATQIITNDHDSESIGKAIGCLTWVVEADDHNRLVPIGAVGELLIEGPIVGRGYLFDEARTAVSFIDSPSWLTKIRGRTSGKLYKTGDLVKYLEDGRLAYIGRKDDQVKIRGHRVELGEIEHYVRQALGIVSKMSEIRATSIAAEVVMPKSYSNRPQLIVFVSTKPDTSQARLDDQNSNDIVITPSGAFTALCSNILEHLSSFLPAYMMPSAFIPLRSMPMALAGKVDRRKLQEIGSNLSEMQLSSVRNRQHRCPSTSQEMILQEIWSVALGIKKESISADDNFFRLGGDSIVAMKLVDLARSKGLSLTLVQLFTNPQLSVLASQMANKGVEKPVTRSRDHLLSKIKTLEPLLKDIVITPPRSPERPYKTVFLTGATGFLGIRLLRQLVTISPTMKVIALVRPIDGNTGLERLKKSANLIKWSFDSHPRNLEVWSGNLALPHLGLDEEQINSLHSEVDVVIHNGAIVHWNIDYETLKPVNVDSTVYLLRAAQTSLRHPRFLFVSGGVMSNASETEHAKGLRLYDSLGYAQSKFVSESLVNRCAQLSSHSRPQFSSVLPGLIIGGHEDGAANSDDFIWRLASAVVEIGGYNEEDAGNWLCMASADRVAKIIIDNISSRTGGSSTININDGLTVREFWQVFNDDFGYDIKPMPKDVWVRELKNLLESSGAKHPFYHAVSFLQDSDWLVGSDADCLGGSYMPTSTSTSSSTSTESESESEPEEKEGSLLKRCIHQNISYLRTRHFFKSHNQKDESGAAAHVDKIFQRSRRNWV